MTSRGMNFVDFSGLQVGDEVTRLLGGQVEMPLKVTALDEEFIHCGPWKFDRTLGYEVDEELGWGLKDEDGNISITGSYLLGKVGKEEVDD